MLSLGLPEWPAVRCALAIAFEEIGKAGERLCGGGARRSRTRTLVMIASLTPIRAVAAIGPGVAIGFSATIGAIAALWRTGVRTRIARLIAWFTASPISLGRAVMLAAALLAITLLCVAIVATRAA